MCIFRSIHISTCTQVHASSFVRMLKVGYRISVTTAQAVSGQLFQKCNCDDEIALKPLSQVSSANRANYVQYVCLNHLTPCFFIIPNSLKNTQVLRWMMFLQLIFTLQIFPQTEHSNTKNLYKIPSVKSLQGLFSIMQ